MIKEIKNHKVAYSVLLLGLISFVITFLYVWPDRNQQKIVAIAVGVFYFIWGVIVHKNYNHINSKVVLEYLAVSVLAVSLLLLLLN
jgi:hypothetical protein